MKKIPFYIIILTFYGCQNNSTEIRPCNLQVDNGLTYSNGKTYSGTCNTYTMTALYGKQGHIKKVKKQQKLVTTFQKVL